MPQERKFNNYPDSIQKLLQENRPQPGEIKRFRLLPGIGQVMLPDTCIIQGIEGKNRYKVEIGIIEGYTPGSEIPAFKRVKFLQNDSGLEVTIDGNNPHDIDVFDFLFLCSWNSDNKGKEFHLKPYASTYKLQMFDPQKETKERVAKNKQIREAQNAIDSLSDEMLDKVAKGMFSNYKDLSKEEKVEKLYKKAEKEPELITQIKNNQIVEAKSLIRDLQELGKIHLDGRTWKFTDSGEKITGVKIGPDLVDYLAEFVTQDEHEDIYEIFEELAEPAEK